MYTLITLVGDLLAYNCLVKRRLVFFIRYKLEREFILFLRGNYFSANTL